MYTQRTCRQFPLPLSLAALALVIAIPAGAASDSASATATVIVPIAIVKAADMSFGKFARGAGGTVTVSTSGVRTVSGVIASSNGSTPTAARFNVTGEASATYAITHSGATDLSNGTDLMALTKFSELTAGGATSGNPTTGALDGTGAQSIYVGGTLTVAANQPVGTYTGTVTVAVEYN